MSTNYYMMITKKELAEKYFANEYELVDTPYFGYEVHIGKRSFGWKPLFQEHHNAYKSVKEMLKFIENNSEHIRIFDEYDREFDIAGLNEELITWGEKQEKRIVHYDDIVGDVDVPIDHCEMSKWESRYGSYYRCCYRKDDEGYEFMEGNFS